MTMSEEIDIDSVNLCTTEDAFEKFQAVSMYEEDEFITLSDIVSPPPPSQDISTILNDMPSDNVVSPQVSEYAPKKRGRKKKSGIDDSDCGLEVSDKCEMISKNNINNLTSKVMTTDTGDSISKVEENFPNPQVPVQQDSTISQKLPTSIKRRAYNRKSINKKPSTKKIIKKIGRPTKQKRILNSAHLIVNDKNIKVNDTVNVNEAFLENTQKVTRTSRRKLDTPLELIDSKGSLIEPKNISSDLSSHSLSNIKIKKTKKTNKKASKDSIEQKISDTNENQENQVLITKDLSEDETEDMPLVALSNKRNKLGNAVISDLELGTEIELLNVLTQPNQASNTIDSAQKNPKKRGRPRKADFNNSTQIKLTLKDHDIITPVLSIDDLELNKSEDNISQPEANKNNSEDTKKNINDNESVQVCQEIMQDTHIKRNSKKPIMSDFEYNIDSIVKNVIQDDSLAQEAGDNMESVTRDSTKRPVRRKVKKNLHYDEGSDEEDPYTNIELSDEEPRRRRGGRYNSDDEYIPGGKQRFSDLSDSDIDDEVDEEEDNLLGESTKKSKYRRCGSGSINKSSKKRCRKGDGDKSTYLDVFTKRPNLKDEDGDFEDLLETSVIKTSEDAPKPWGTTKEFKDFLAKISQGTDIKIKKAKSIDNMKTPLLIPVLEPTEPKKTVEMCSQTNIIKTKPVAIQTNSVYEVPMKNQVTLTADQSEKACEFLSGIVKTTSELGQLMTQKSEDFIDKKINTAYVTDTFKMDYCVKKSFLLFRLAKHNLVQMEKDLAKQYEEFLKENHLIQHREIQTIIASTSRTPNSDSDCEIVEEPIAKQQKNKITFNPKTVFLNKELSIKIAKKPNEEPKPKEKLQQQVWINDSIMIKKVKSVQSFLAQDSRNKKPPDTYVTLEMVSDFFKKFNHQKALSLCAQFVRPEWLNVKKNHVCYYFFDKTSDCSASSIDNAEELITEITLSENNLQNVNDTISLTECNILCPDSLLSLCTKVIQTQLVIEKHVVNNNNNKCYVTRKSAFESRTTVIICNDKTQNVTYSSDLSRSSIYALNKNWQSVNIECLKTLCYQKVLELINIPDFCEYNLKKISPDYSNKNYRIHEINEDNCKVSCEHTSNADGIKSLFSLCLKIIQDNCEIKLERSSVVDCIKPLFLICFKIIQDIHKTNLGVNSALEKNILYKPNSLKCIVFNKVKNIFSANIKNANSCEGEIANIEPPISVSFLPIVSKRNNDDTVLEINNQILITPFSLKSLCFNTVNRLCNVQYDYDLKSRFGSNTDIDALNFTINNVNTVSEDVFLSTENHDYIENNHQTEATYLHDEESNFSDDCEINYDNNIEVDDDNWVSQVEMKEPRSFIESINNINSNESPEASDLHSNDVVNIKIEPLDEFSANVIPSSVKTEPIDEDENIYTSLVVVAKEENVHRTSSSREPIDRQNSNSYDENAFEAFVSSNKMMLCLDNYENINDDIFSQSTSRVRRQYEPDSYDDIENFADSLNLLVPQNVETAKDRLMESSSDEDTNQKKKPDKRRGKSKRSTKISNVPSVKENATPKCELAILTRKMREKIRQVEKQNESSESELEDTALSVRKEKEKTKDKAQKRPLCENKVPEKEIQCNDVDSTEQINENEQQSNDCALDEDPPLIQHDESQSDKNNDDNEQNHDNNEDSRLTDIGDGSMSPLINANEPVELLECEPALPLLEDFMEKTHTKRKTKIDAVTAPVYATKLGSSSYIDRHGWYCYPIDTEDVKIYQYAHVPLDKLPESFVKTYFKYQNLSEQTQDDTEVDKLTNLQSLHRNQSKEKCCVKLRDNKNVSTESHKAKSEEHKPLQTDVKIEQCDELSLSEDETNVEDIAPPLAPMQSSENCMAKDFLMNDDSDLEKLDVDVKKLKNNDQIDSQTDPKKLECASKLKEEVNEKETSKADSLMLTADKMMNKELALLHAPVDIKQEEPDTKNAITKPTKCISKTVIKPNAPREKSKEDDSSSEEEKQWFTTKEKLLKRLEKKQECPKMDDAKRAKIVSEFIEKRSDGPKIRQRGRPARRRSMKKLMERRKQMKILTRELLGDDSSHSGKKSYQTYGKGRRNIRKVINKKSLAHSTVMANMEEFERKQRLSVRQTQLREVLSCEEGVNVVVINDELSLEYDFEELRPIVTVHPFFTKVMKAHQYEGVKFMWDACFESVSQVQSGHAGGGCILAHCMGLGKTLQVLALLHTVLTHPQVGMQRVLVCCPLSTVLNWVDEIHKWIGPVTGDIKVFELSKLKKTYERAYQLEDWYNGGGIFIIGYELFRSLTTLDSVLDCVRLTIVNKIRTALLDPGPDIIICDEGHLLKNDCSVLAVAMSRVATRRRIVLTGTPMQNNLREYYCMVNFVKPNLLGSYVEYSNRFENPIMNGQHRDSREEDIKLMKARTHILHKVLEGCLQRLEASVLYPYLPKKHEYTVFVSLTKSQRELYTHYLTTYAKETKQSVLKDFHVLQKIWTHPQVLHNFFLKTRDEEKEQKIKVEKEDDLVQEDLGASEDIKPNATETWWLPYVADSDVLDALNSSNKFLVVFQLLEECIAMGDKVLIFSTSLYTMDALEYFLRRINNWSLGREYYRLDGSVPAEVRQKWCREFNAESNTGTKLFLISTRAGSLGLNMTAANRVIILDTSWNPAHDIQSIFRVYRFGQKKDCYIYRLVAMGTMEQKIYERSVTKQAVACRVVDEQQIDRHYNMSELTELYRLDEDGSGVSAGLAAGVRDAALLRVASCDAASGPLLYAVHEHDSLLRGSGETGLPEDERAAVWSQFQEEHATKHIQNIAMNLPKKNDLSLIMQGTENSQQYPTNNHLVCAPDANSRPKRGRKSSVANKNIPIQPSTSSQSESYPLDPNTEETVVKQIMNILIKHNFHINNNPNEISELVKNVRKTIAHRERGRFKNVDPVTASIAKVLIEERSTSTPIPALTDITPNQSQTQFGEIESVETIVGTPANYSIYDTNETENKEYTGSILSELSRRKLRRQRQETDVNPTQLQTHFHETESTETIVGMPVDNSIYNNEEAETHVSIDSDYAERKRKRQRRESDEEYVPERQKTKNDVTGTKKLKTRNLTDYNLSSDSENTDETITSDIPPVVVIDETVEQQIMQTYSKKAHKKKEQVKIKKIIKKKNNSEKDSESIKDCEIQHKDIEKEIGVDIVREQKTAQKSINESIILSDDDDSVEAVTVHQVKNVIAQEDIVGNKEDKNRKQVEEIVIPLHKSLLNNDNFIKIVAHTYLTGNPMLDEDAAVLAAQYSTLKALKEIESTGKDIVSGPIYDIAVQVLGKDLLKRMHNATATKKDTDNLQLGCTNNNEKLSAEALTKTEKSAIDSEALPRNNDPDIKKKAGPKSKTMILQKANAAPLISNIKAQTEYEIQNPTTSACVPAAIARSDPHTATSDNEVVPVEMFQCPATPGTSYSLTSQDECILPDDDDEDDIIIGHPHSPPFVRTSNDLIKRNSRPLLLNSVSSLSNSERANASYPKVVQIIQKQHTGNPIPLPPPPIISSSTNTSVSRPSYSQAQIVSTNQAQSTRFVKSNSTGLLAENAKPAPISMKTRNFENDTAIENSKISTAVASLSNETICLDSDDEDSEPIAVKSTTPKALKSTTKRSILKSNSLTSHNGSPNIDQVATTVISQNRLNNTVLESKKKIVLVSAANFANLETSKNFNKNMQPQTIVQRGSANVSAVLADKSSAEPKIITEQPLSANISGSVIQQAKTKCLPGDIIRINKSGKIDILRKTERPHSKAISVGSPSNSSAKVAVEEVITGDKVCEQFATPQMFGDKKKQEVPNKVKTIAVEQVQKTVDNIKELSERGRTSNASSSGTRSESPDPLLVLKNVVHIPAGKYQTMKSKIVKECNIPIIPKDIVKNAKKGLNRIDMHSLPSTSKINNTTVPKKEKVVIVRPTTESTKKIENLKRTDTSHKALGCSKSTDSKSKVIDLTDCFAVKNESVRPNKMVIKNIWSGTSKEILISNVGTLISNVKNKPTTSSVDMTPKVYVNSRNAKTPAPTICKKPDNDRGKRSSPWSDVNSYKKKKSEGNKVQMTLEDFDLDDLDDIIELE